MSKEELATVLAKEQYLHWLLRGGSIIQVDKRFVVYTLLQDREVLAQLGPQRVWLCCVGYMLLGKPLSNLQQSKKNQYFRGCLLSCL